MFIGWSYLYILRLCYRFLTSALLAGMFTQDRRERECVLELLAGCRSRTGWPADPLEDELEEIWADGSAKERQ